MSAIKQTGNELVAALDPNDSVGVLDSHFPKAKFFVEFERFDRHLDLLRRDGRPVQYVSICSPNYLHDAHIRFALRLGADAICEKPLVLNPWNLDALATLAEETGRSVHTILQLRLHPSILELKKRAESQPADTKADVELTYITSRGGWYHVSWKGNTDKSGGIATNIGVHFFDMLTFVYGAIQSAELHYSTADTMAGYLELERARVRWFLSIDAGTLPASAVEDGKKTYRSVLIDGEELEFSSGFTDLHTVSYERILAGEGYSITDTRAAIAVVSELRTMAIATQPSAVHPFIADKV